MFHYDWLHANLDKGHPIFHQQLFASGFAKDHKEKVVTGEGTCPFTAMEATGVPPSVKMAQKLKAVEEGMKKQGEEQLKAQQAQIVGLEGSIAGLQQGKKITNALLKSNHTH